MGKQSRRKPAARAAAAKKSGVTHERAARLCRLLHILSKAPQTRKALLHRLRVDQRAFYRDLDTLREAGVAVELQGRHYHLRTAVADALPLVPFPDPLLTFGEALILARGRTRVHRLLKQRLREVLGEAGRAVS